MALQSIGSLLPSAIARTNNTLALRLVRLSNQSRISSPRLDASALNANLRFVSQLSDLGATTRSIAQTRSVLASAEAGLSNIGDSLEDARRLEIQSQFATGSEKSVLQSAFQNTISQIDRELSSTRFGNQSLSNAVIRTSQDTAASLSNVSITRVSSPSAQGQMVNVVVQSTGSRAETSLNNFAAISSGQAFEFEIRGSQGSARISVAAQINALSNQTGIVASSNGVDLDLSSSALGSAQFITVTDSDGAGVSAGQTFGTDASVSVNGVQAQADGNQVRFDSNGLQGSFVINASTAASTSTSFDLQGGGLRVPSNLSGGAQVLGIPSFGSSLGSSSGVGSIGTLLAGAGTTQDRLSIIEAAQSEALAGRVQVGLADQTLSRLNTLAERQFDSVSRATSDLTGTSFVEEAVGFANAANQQKVQLELLKRSQVSQRNLLELLQ